MRMLIYGAGVLGSNMANNLYKAGKDVTLLARGAWYENLTKNGLVIDHQYSFRKDTPKVKVVKELKPEDEYDVIFVVMRYNQLDAVLPVLKENISENIVFVGNNPHPKKYRDALAEKKVFFAFTLSAGHREKDCVKSIDLKKVTIGTLKEDSLNRMFIESIFKDTKYKVVYEDNMEDYLLCHLISVVPVVFACYKCDGDLRKIKNDKAYFKEVIEVYREAYRIMQANGHQILPKEDEAFESKGWERLMTAFFKLMCATKLGEICASDHAMNAKDEMIALTDGLKEFYDSVNASYPLFLELEKSAGNYR